MRSGADALIIDLEDSVAPDSKAKARESAAAFLKNATTAARPYMIVRVNSLQTGLTDADLDAVVPAKPDAIMLPKAEGGASVMHADAKLAVREAISGLPDGAHQNLADCHRNRGIAVSRRHLRAAPSKRLLGLTWGAEDLSAELGAQANRDAQGRFLDPYRLARALCLVGASAAQVPAIDTVYVDFRNSDGFRLECEEALRDGFTGKMAIHPAQVPIINEVFTPSAEAIARAKAVVDAFAANPGAGVVNIGGVMFDQPHLTRARRLLDQAKVGQS